jgi:streptogramin lyase
LINIIEPGVPFHQAIGIDVDSAGQIWVASEEGSTPGVYRFSSAGTLLSHWATAASRYPAGIAGDGSGNVWVAFPASCHVQKFTSTGASIEKFGACGKGTGKLSSTSTGGGNLAHRSRRSTLGIQQRGQRSSGGLHSEKSTQERRVGRRL